MERRGCGSSPRQPSAVGIEPVCTENECIAPVNDRRRGGAAIAGLYAVRDNDRLENQTYYRFSILQQIMAEAEASRDRNENHCRGLHGH